MSKEPTTERVPASKLTLLAIAQFAQLQRIALRPIEVAASEADAKPASEGWTLDLQAGEWVRR